MGRTPRTTSKSCTAPSRITVTAITVPAPDFEVDTGLHALGWSRQQAIDYFLENSPQAQNNIENEVDRYIGYTGQALAYKLGQREIFRLRDEAKQTMGARFDIKGFHDTVLESGPVPLDLLSDLVVEWATS